MCNLQYIKLKYILSATKYGISKYFNNFDKQWPESECNFKNTLFFFYPLIFNNILIKLTCAPKYRSKLWNELLKKRKYLSSFQLSLLSTLFIVLKSDTDRGNNYLTANNKVQKRRRRPKKKKNNWKCGWGGGREYMTLTPDLIILGKYW